MHPLHLEAGQHGGQGHGDEEHAGQLGRNEQQHQERAHHRQSTGAELQKVRGNGGVHRVHIVADAADKVPRRVGVEILHRQLAHAVKGRLPQVAGHALAYLDEPGGDKIIQNRGAGVAGQHPAAVPQDSGKIHAAGLRAHGVHRPAGQHRCHQRQEVGRHHQHDQKNQLGAVGPQEPGHPPQEGFLHPLAPPICSSAIRR